MSEAKQDASGGVLPYRPVLAAMGILLAVKALLMSAPPLADEAYYWMWGQQLDWSYHDHPPLNALLLRLSSELFGWNRFALRAPGLLTYCISLAVIAWWGARLLRETGENGWLTAVAVAAASPFFFVYQTLAFPDHVLIACLLVSVHLFVLFIENAGRGAVSWRHLYGAAVAIGLAGLAKYSAVFVGLAYVAWFLFTRTGRRLLVTPHVWIAGSLALAMQSPVIWWNYQHDLTSFRYHLSGRFFGARDAMAVIWRLILFLGPAVLLLSPFLMPGLIRFLRGRQDGDIARFRALALPALVTALPVFAAFTLVVHAFFHWLVAPLALFLPVAAAVASTREMAWHLGFGVVVSALVTIHLSIIPVSSLFGIRGMDDASFGIGQAALRSEAEAQYRDADLILTSNYMLAALLGFELGRTDVYSYSERDEQYDLWFDPADHVGASAVLVTDMHRPLYSWERNMFETIVEIETVTATRFGLPVNEFTLYYATGMRPEPICCTEIGRAP